jgi:thiamine-phosphate pyrophosphorylase
MPWDSRRTLYLVTPPARTGGRDVLDVVARVLAVAPERVAVQLRAKDSSALDQLQLANRLSLLCKACRVPFLVSERLDVALAAGADGVHLPAAGISAVDARKLMPMPKILGASCHSATEVTERTGADFVVLGPVFETPSKQRYGAPLGLEALAEGVRRAPVPVLAIGGVRAATAGQVAATGCAGVACIAEIFEADDPGVAALAVIREFDGGRTP